MFVGHYGVSFAARRSAASVPLWVLFIAVQLLDVAWAPLVLAGVEKVRIVPGITASNPLDLCTTCLTRTASSRRYYGPPARLSSAGSRSLGPGHLLRS